MKVYVLTEDEYHNGIYFSRVIGVYSKRIDAIRAGERLKEQSENVIGCLVNEYEVQ